MQKDCRSIWRRNHFYVNKERGHFQDIVSSYLRLQTLPSLACTLALQIGANSGMPSDISVPIETARLIVRPYSADDAVWYHKMSLRNKEHLARYESENPIMSIMTESDAEKTINEFISLWNGQKYRFLGVFLKDANQFVAQIYLGRLDDQLPEFGIGYIADVEHVGNGYVTEVVAALVKDLFNEAGAHRIQIETDDTNLRSISVAERCGFVKEGHLRENKKHPDGTISGTVFYGLLKNEFQT
jgi:[ribosomal protein S5]-alanine N-acetyltransferase